MLGFIIFLIWYSTATGIVMLLVTGGKIASMGVFAAGFITCLFGLSAVAAISSVEVAGSGDE